MIPSTIDIAYRANRGTGLGVVDGGRRTGLESPGPVYFRPGSELDGVGLQSEWSRVIWNFSRILGIW